MIKVLIGALLIVQILGQVTPPVWPEVFTQSFVESYNGSHLHTTGRFHYDAKRQQMRVDRQDGSNDMICNSVLPNVSTVCTQLIRDQKRYIVHPERRACCMCCDAAHGCGILKRDWLNTAKYIGEQALSGETFYKWSILGNFSIYLDGDMTDLYYAAKTEQRTPRRFTTGTRSVQDWIMNTYSTEPIPDAVFALPEYCKNTCPATTVCGKFQASNVEQQ